MATFNYIDLGSTDYKACWEQQEVLHAEVVAAKGPGAASTDKNFFLLVEHPHVYTMGKSGNADNMLIPDAFLQKINATFYRINRGGDITYHGPGQLVGYPIFDLRKAKLGIREYINRMEEAIVQTIAEYGIKGERREGATGVWIDPLHPVKSRKICAIGVRVSRQVTMHGFALNVNPDMRYYNYINPCGFDAGSVTSLVQETGHEISMEEVKQHIKRHFNALF